MTVDQVLGQIQQIRSQLALLAPQRASTTSGAAFTSALSAATSGTTAASATASTASVDGATLAADGVTGDDVVQAALQYKGVPYVLGGESKSGIDCSGLVQASFKDLGVEVPRLVHEQQTLGQKVDSLKDAEPGDLIVLNGGDHIAIYMGNDTVIHAPYPGRSVSVQKAWFDDKDIVTIRRIVPAGDGSTATGTGAAPAAASTATGTSTATAAASGVTGSSSASSVGTLSAASMARAVGMLGMYGAESGADSGSGSSSLSSMLGALTGTGSSSTSSMASMLGTSAGGTASTSTAQQLLAARAAMLESGAA